MADKNQSNKWNVCAVCFAGSRVLSYGFNKPKTEASIVLFAEQVDSMYEGSKNNYVSECRHAEVDAIKKVADISKIDCLIVVRKTKNGKPSMARPCNVCQQVIRDAGINKVYFSDENGKLKLFK